MYVSPDKKLIIIDVEEDDPIYVLPKSGKDEDMFVRWDKLGLSISDVNVLATFILLRNRDDDWIKIIKHSIKNLDEIIYKGLTWREYIKVKYMNYPELDPLDDVKVEKYNRFELMDL